jgi:hypothetical protein
MRIYSIFVLLVAYIEGIELLQTKIKSRRPKVVKESPKTSF